MHSQPPVQQIKAPEGAYQEPDRIDFPDVEIGSDEEESTEEQNERWERLREADPFARDDPYSFQQDLQDLSNRTLEIQNGFTRARVVEQQATSSNYSPDATEREAIAESSNRSQQQMNDEIPITRPSPDSPPPENPSSPEPNAPNPKLSITPKNFIDEPRTKRSWARGKFWALLAASDEAYADISTAMIFASLALQKREPGDENYDAAANARGRFHKWRDMPDSSFYEFFGKYLATFAFAVEAQIYLMSFIEHYFPSAPIMLQSGEVTSLRNSLVTSYQQAKDSGKVQPSTVIHERLAEGLTARNTSGEVVRLPRAQSASIAALAYWSIYDQNKKNS